jgi:thiosulfate dehydrogenase [quinone] large subunit
MSLRETLNKSTTYERAITPLRIFLGFTFLYAGLQKFASPAFFNKQDPNSIFQQLVLHTQNNSQRSPIAFFLSHLVEHASLLGALVALGEVAIGVGTLLGLYSRIAALGGLALSFGLFLTITFHTSPYFTGADLIYALAWTPIIIAGLGHTLTLDGYLARRAATVTNSSDPVRRWIVVSGAAVGAAAVISAGSAGISAVVGRALRKSSTTTTTTGTLSTTTTTGGSTTTSAGASAGTAVGAASQVPVNGSATFTLNNGNPGIIVQPTAGEFVAYDATCSHAGCPVSYYASNNMFVCPCHGSTFSVSNGDVLGGPAPTGLPKYPITDIGGQLYVKE